MKPFADFWIDEHGAHIKEYDDEATWSAAAPLIPLAIRLDGGRWTDPKRGTATVSLSTRLALIAAGVKPEDIA